MKVQINDGGRAKYFEASRVSDCVTRAIAIATQRDYKQVYKEITKLVGYTPRNGIRHKDTKKIMAHFGGCWKATMTIGSGCHVHLKENEIPMQGRIICNLSGHVCAVVDGVIHDTFDPSRNGTRCVYGYWMFGQSESQPVEDEKESKEQTEEGRIFYEIRLMCSETRWISERKTPNIEHARKTLETFRRKYPKRNYKMCKIRIIELGEVE